jgi:hypothetical protein
MMPSSKITISPHVVSRAVGDETVILDLESGTYFGIDPIGARMWQMMEAGKTLAEICDVIIDEYDVSREILEQDATCLASELAAKRLISIA